MKSVGVIHNPNANKNRKRKVDAKTLELLVPGLFRVTGNPNLDGGRSLDDAVRDFDRIGVKVVASNGGDGTFQKVLTSYMLNTCEHELPTFLVLPSGTVNMLANSIGSTSKPEVALKKVVEGEFDKLTKYSLRTLYVTSDSKDYYGTVFADGSVYNFLQRYNDSSFLGETSKFKAWKMVAKGIFSSFGDELVKPSANSLDIDQRSCAIAYTALFAAGFKPTIMGIKPFNWTKDLDEGIYEGHTYLNGRRLAKILPHLFMGRRTNYAQYNIGVKEIKMELEEGLGYTIDGEVFTGKKVVIRPGPKINLIVI